MSLASIAYARLRDSILRGELRPNARLVETELAEWLQLSRTPVREALARLASDGLVTSRRRGWSVREYTLEEVREIHEVRAALEGMAAFLACTRARDNELAELADLHGRQRRDELATPASDSLVEYNEAFHRAVIIAAHNDRLEYFVRQNREFFFTYRIAKLYGRDDALASLAGHDKVVEALTARDGERAEAAMREHILDARDAIVEKLY